jgi:hypothetical protein
VADGVGLVLLALVVWGGSMEASSDAKATALFAVSLGALLIGLRPWYGLALVVASVLALGQTSHWMGGGVSPWMWVFAVLATPGLWLVLRRFGGIAWAVASLPLWAIGGSYPDDSLISKGAEVVAIAMLMTMPLKTVWRLVSSKPSPGASVIPIDSLRRGALVPVAPRVFLFTKGVWALKLLTGIAGAGMLAGAVILIVGDAMLGTMFLAVGASLGLGFGLSLFLTVRQRYRVDAVGIHRRVVFGETTIPWTAVTDLTTRDVMIRWVVYNYFCVNSATAEIAFPTTLHGAEELRGIVEQATGMRWG